MKYLKAKRCLLVLTALAWTAVLFGPTQVLADSILCTPITIGYSQPISDNVTPSTACELGSNNNDSVAQVNADTMFNSSDWVEFLSPANGSITGLGDFNPALTSGSLSLAVNWTTFDNLMIVLKDGGGTTTEPKYYVGYLIAQDHNGTIDWISPFVNTNSGNPKGVSHIKAYVRGEGNHEVPEPTSLLLLGSGLLGLAGIARMRSFKP